MATVWVKRTDVEGARYIEVEDLDLQQLTVSKLIARWLTVVKLEGIAADLVSLKLVPNGARKPTADKEAAATLLDDPSQSLSDAGIADSSWLLAVIVSAATAPTAGTPLLGVLPRHAACLRDGAIPP